MRTRLPSCLKPESANGLLIDKTWKRLKGCGSQGEGCPWLQKEKWQHFARSASIVKRTGTRMGPPKRCTLRSCIHAPAFAERKNDGRGNALSLPARRDANVCNCASTLSRWPPARFVSSRRTQFGHAHSRGRATVAENDEICAPYTTAVDTRIHALASSCF